MPPHRLSCNARPVASSSGRKSPLPSALPGLRRSLRLRAPRLQRAQSERKRPTVENAVAYVKKNFLAGSELPRLGAALTPPRAAGWIRSPTFASMAKQGSAAHRSLCRRKTPFETAAAFASRHKCDTLGAGHQPLPRRARHQSLLGSRPLRFRTTSPSNSSPTGSASITGPIWLPLIPAATSGTGTSKIPTT